MPEVLPQHGAGWPGLIALLVLESARLAREYTRADLRGEHCARSCASEVAALRDELPCRPSEEDQAFVGQLSLCEARLAEKEVCEARPNRKDEEVDGRTVER